MRIKLLLVMISLLLSGCSLLIERSAKYSEFALEYGHTREEVNEVLGEPLCKTTFAKRPACYVYPVKGRVFDSSDHWAFASGRVTTLGLHEIVTFPIQLLVVASQAIYPTKKYLEVCKAGDRYWLTERRKSKNLCVTSQAQ